MDLPQHSRAPGVAGMPRAPHQGRLQQAARLIGIAVLALAAAVLAGWAGGSAALRQVAPGLPPMVPNTAVGLALAGLSLWLLAAGRRRALAGALAAGAALIGAVSLAEYAAGAAHWLDELLVAAPAGTYPGRPSPNSALNLALTGAALLLLAARRERLALPAQALAALATINGARALLGYAAGAAGLYALSADTGVALHGAVAFVALGLGVCAVRPDQGAMAVLTSRGAGGAALRMLLPLGIGLPLVVGALTFRGEAQGVLGSGVTLVLLTLLDLAVFIGLAALLNRAEAASRAAAADAMRQAARAEALLDVARRLNAQLDLSAVLRTVCDVAVEALGTPLVAVALADAQQRRLTPAAHAGLPEAARLALRPVAPAAHAELVARLGSPAVVEDIAYEAGVPNAAALALAGARTLATVPLQRGDALIGTLTVASRGEPRRFSSDELALLCGLADSAAQAVVNARLHATAEAQALANARLHATLERRLRHVRALHAIDSAILTSPLGDPSLEVVLEQACAELQVDVAQLWLAGPDGPPVPGPARGLRSRRRPLPLAPGALALQAAEERRALWRAGDGAELGAPHLEAERLVFVAAAPLVASGALLGVLEVGCREHREPDVEWLSFLATLAGQAAIAVDYLRALDRLADANAQLVAAYDDTLEGWARALDLRDHDTAGHCERVTALTLRLARAWGMGEDELTHVRRGALLHDIGKLGVPDSILLKPGALSADEQAVMQQHPVYAHEWLAPIAFLRPALDIPIAHHEKWDGTGYPRGLKGEEIPLSARLFAVVDVYDALTSDRPYRRAWGLEQALAHLEAGAGTHFDPQVVAAFRTMLLGDDVRTRAVGE